MAKIGIMTCSNATQDLGCSSPSCLKSLRERLGAFADYDESENLVLTGIINCPGCPTLTGPDKLLQRIKGLTEFGVDTIHFSYCMKALCPFTGKYKKALEEAFPEIKIVVGTHAVAVEPEKYREKVKKLFSQEKKGMLDIILKRDI